MPKSRTANTFNMKTPQPKTSTVFHRGTKRRGRRPKFFHQNQEMRKV